MSLIKEFAMEAYSGVCICLVYLAWSSCLIVNRVSFRIFKTVPVQSLGDINLQAVGRQWNWNSMEVHFKDINLSKERLWKVLRKVVIKFSVNFNFYMTKNKIVSFWVNYCCWSCFSGLKCLITWKNLDPNGCTKTV